MAGPPKSRGMIMYVLKNMMESFKVGVHTVQTANSIYCIRRYICCKCQILKTQQGNLLAWDQFLEHGAILRFQCLFFPGWKEREGGHSGGQGPLWQLLLRAASSTSGTDYKKKFETNDEIKIKRVFTKTWKIHMFAFCSWESECPPGGTTLQRPTEKRL